MPRKLDLNSSTQRWTDGTKAIVSDDTEENSSDMPHHRTIPDDEQAQRMSSPELELDEIRQSDTENSDDEEETAEPTTSVVVEKIQKLTPKRKTEDKTEAEAPPTSHLEVDVDEETEGISDYKRKKQTQIDKEEQDRKNRNKKELADIEQKKQLENEKAVRLERVAQDILNSFSPDYLVEGTHVHIRNSKIHLCSRGPTEKFGDYKVLDRTLLIKRNIKNSPLRTIGLDNILLRFQRENRSLCEPLETKFTEGTARFLLGLDHYTPFYHQCLTLGDCEKIRKRILYVFNIKECSCKKKHCFDLSMIRNPESDMSEDEN